MDGHDWIAATGHAIVGRGGRPINPKTLMRTVKARPASPALRAARQQILLTARTISEADAVLSSPTTAHRYARAAAPRDTSLLAQSAPGAAGAAARLQHAAAVQRARKRF
jgi:hypothetical protein